MTQHGEDYTYLTIRRCYEKTAPVEFQLSPVPSYTVRAHGRCYSTARRPALELATFIVTSPMPQRAGI